MRNTTNIDTITTTINAFDTIDDATCHAIMRDIVNVARDAFIDATYNERLARVMIVASLDTRDVVTLIDSIIRESCDDRNVSIDAFDVTHDMQYA